MRFRAAYQLAPTVVPGDAVSHQVLILDAMFRRWGLRSSVIAEHHVAMPDVRIAAPNAMPNVFSDDEIAIYHHSTGSELARLFALARGAKRVLIYHNITPPAMLAHAPDLAARAHLGLRQIGEVMRAADVILADSRYNLTELGPFATTPAAVAPLVINHARREMLESAARDRAQAPPADPMWLFVGRLVPHKRIEVLVAALRIYREQHDPRARLLVVGGDDEAPDYAAELRHFAATECADAVEFAGKLTGEPLRAAFARATLFMTASAHEGFCVPLVESMIARLPVLAVDAGAVGETLGESGVLLDQPDPALIAEAAQILWSDERSRDEIIRRQTQRAGEFTEQRLETVIRSALE